MRLVLEAATRACVLCERSIEPSQIGGKSPLRAADRAPRNMARWYKPNSHEVGYRRPESCTAPHNTNTHKAVALGT